MSKSALLNLIDEDRKMVLHHEEDGKTYVETRQNVDHIIQAAKIMADEKPGKDFRHAAYIPAAVMDRAFNEGWFHDRQAWKRWANDPANACYRTWGGRL